MMTRRLPLISILALLAGGALSAATVVVPSRARGDQAMQERRFGDALTAYQAALAARPGTPSLRRAVSIAAGEAGAQALAAGHYKRARECFAIAKQARGGGRDAHLDALDWLAANHPAVRGIKPEYVHSILVVYALRTDAVIETFAGGKRRLADMISARQLADHAVTMQLFRMTVEAFSRGRLSLRFATEKIKAPVTWVGGQKRPAKKRSVYQAAQHRIPGLGRILGARLADFDTSMVFWAAGGVPVRATGGSGTRHLLPGLVSSPRRGFVIMAGRHTHWRGLTGAHLHEWGHVVENFGVGRTHALYPNRIEETRRLHPAFSGVNEFAWWRYVFDKLLPARMAKLAASPRGRTLPMENLNFRLRDPGTAAAKKFAALLPLVKDVPDDRLWQAKTLYAGAAAAWKKGDQAGAVKLARAMEATDPAITRAYAAAGLRTCRNILEGKMRQPGKRGRRR